MNINLMTILKPILMFNGITDLSIKFSAENKCAVLAGKQNGQEFSKELSFEQLEAMISGQAADQNS